MYLQQGSRPAPFNTWWDAFGLNCTRLEPRVEILGPPLDVLAITSLLGDGVPFFGDGLRLRWLRTRQEGSLYCTECLHVSRTQVEPSPVNSNSSNGLTTFPLLVAS